MGNTASGDNGDTDNDNLDPFDGCDTLGYRVLGVQPDSPAAAAGLVSFLDFLIGCNGQMLLGCGDDLEEGEEYDDIDLPGLLQEHKGTEMEFLVWNIKSQKERLVKLIPNDTWGGAGLLGVTIRLDNYQGAEERLIRVLEVKPKSPAAVSGLVPDTDFLLGTTTQTLDSVKTLAMLLQEHENTVLDLYVYNSEADMVRMIALMPTVTWADSRGGLLGAELGTGYLHRLPKAVTETVGASVQRKVRYVGTSATATGKDTSGDQKTNGDGGGDGKHPNGLRSQAASAASSNSSFTTVNMSPTDPSKGTALVEVEPQLEMEAQETESEDEEQVPQPVQRQQRKEKVQSAAAARVAAAAAITESSASHNYNLNGNYHHSAEQLYELQQRMPPPPPEFQPPMLPDQLKLSRSGSSEGSYPANRSSSMGHSTAFRLGEDQFPPQPLPEHLRSSRRGSSDGQDPKNIQWNRSSSTDGESSIGNDLPVRIATPVKFNRVEVVSPPSSMPGGFTSVNAIFSKPPPKGGQPESPVQYHSPAGYVKPAVPAAGLLAAPPFPSSSPTGHVKAAVPPYASSSPTGRVKSGVPPYASSSPTGRVKSAVPPYASSSPTGRVKSDVPLYPYSSPTGRVKSAVPEAEFIRGTKPKTPIFPPPPMMHYVSQEPSTNK